MRGHWFKQEYGRNIIYCQSLFQVWSLKCDVSSASAWKSETEKNNYSKVALKSRSETHIKKK